MTCFVLACLVTFADPWASAAERVQEQFERHYLQDVALAGPADGEIDPPAAALSTWRVITAADRRP